ncbi:MAG: tyrosine--tRNA ligase [Ferruginibacter sp.]
MNALIEELRWRGMIQDIMPGTEEQLNKEITTGYIGFDPTADSLHIGSMVPIILLMHLQKAGHKPIALIGGATGMVGDPSGKSAERNLLDETTLEKNITGIKKQLSHFLDFDNGKTNAARLVNNYDWFRQMSFLDFIRDTGKHITVNYMMAKDSVKNRLEGESGMSFTEFSYQLVQGYDFLWLFENMDCRLQMGGSDQWGNIVTGSELIRRKAGGEAFAFTCPLIKKADGGKFGKTETGNVWLDPIRTTPYQFYQFWLNATDTDAENWIKIYSFLSRENIDALIHQQKENPASRTLQKALAREITIMVHGEEAYDKAIQTTEKLFSGNTTDAEDLDEADLLSIEGIVKLEANLIQLNAGWDIINLLAETGILASKSEARKMLMNNGISINRKKVTVGETITGDHLLHYKFLLVQKGKKNYYLVEFS